MSTPRSLASLRTGRLGEGADVAVGRPERGGLGRVRRDGRLVGLDDVRRVTSSPGANDAATWSWVDCWRRGRGGRGRPCAAGAGSRARPCCGRPGSRPRRRRWRAGLDRSISPRSACGCGAAGGGRRRLALGGDRDDRRADGDRLALGDEQAGDGAGVRRRQLDQRLGGLDLDDDVVDRDDVADLDLPGHDLGLGETLADVGQLVLRHQVSLSGQKASERSTASSTRSRSGSHSSSMREGGYGVSNPPTRSTGDSRE